MILSKSLKLSVLALCLASLSSSSVFGKTTRCGTACDEEVTTEQLLFDAGSLSLSILTYYLYYNHVRDHIVSRADSTDDEARHHIVEELGKVVAGAWFLEQAKEFAKHARCYVTGKISPVLAQAQAAVSSEA